MATEKTRLCIDGRMLAADETGVASYGHAVIAGLAAVGSTPVILSDGSAGRFAARTTLPARVVRHLRARLPYSVRLRDTLGGATLHAHDVFRLAQVHFAATGRLLQLRAPGDGGVMHWTYPIPARIVGWHNVYTVHDVIPLVAPALSAMDAAPLRARLTAIAERAERIVAVSAWGRQSILDALKLDGERVVNCGSAVARMAPGDGTLPAGLAANGYLLYCGVFEPRKNLDRLVAAWRASGVTMPLAIAGPVRAEDAAIRARLIAAGVTMLPYQARPELMDLVANARALLFPSLEEGFGLPVAEAMTLGTPVLTANRGALAETAGDAALLVDPLDVDAIAEGIAQLAVESGVVATLRARGTARARAFAPAAFGDRLTALYANVAGVPVRATANGTSLGFGI